MQDLTTGPVARHLLKTTSVMLLMMVFQTLYFLVDLYWIGRLGTQAGFQLRWIWYLSAGAVLVQRAVGLLLLRREFKRRLVFPELSPALATALPVS